MAKYYDDLTLEEMFEHYDHTHMMADDHRAWQKGRRQREIWQAKLAEQGGWTKELVEVYNKYAPGGDDRYIVFSFNTNTLNGIKALDSLNDVYHPHFIQVDLMKYDEYNQLH